MNSDTGHSDSNNTTPFPGRNSNGNGSGITAKQMRYVLTLGRRHDMNSDDVNEMSFELFGSPLDSIGKSEASELIERLSA